MRAPVIRRLAATVLGTMVATWMLFWAFPASPHEAAAGWSYPFACCSGFDCREVSDALVRDNQDGSFTIVATGERLVSGDTRVRLSPDGQTHWCSVAGRDDGRTICLFVPPRRQEEEAILDLYKAALGMA